MDTVRTRIVAGLATVATTATIALTAAPAQARPGDGIREGQLDRLIEKVHTLGAVGVTAEVVTPDGSWSGAAGDAERGPRVPAEEDARFRAGSVSKQLVSVLALQLVEDGTWSLGTTIGDVRPGLWLGQEDVTLRQLLSHTSGLPEFLTPLAGTADTTRKFLDVISRRYDDRGLVDLARALPTTARGQFSYANTNFVVVGMMLEKETGRSLPSLVRDRVFEPAGMRDSDWPTTKRFEGPRLKEYGKLYGETVSLASFQPSMFGPAGALVTTAGDLDRFQLALSRGDLVDRRLVRKMRAVVSADPASGLEYGLGSYRVPDPCRPGRYLHGHDGGTWGTLTLSYSSPGGDRRASAAMTGRDYDGDNAAVRQLNVLVVKALAQTCGGVPVQD